MEIQKIFSSWDDEERLYSVLVSEEELERIFSRIDYHGLDLASKELLKKRRSDLAKSLMQNRKRAQSYIPGGRDLYRKALDLDLEHAKQMKGMYRDMAVSQTKRNELLSKIRK